MNVPLKCVLPVIRLWSRPRTACAVDYRLKLKLPVCWWKLSWRTDESSLVRTDLSREVRPSTEHRSIDHWRLAVLTSSRKRPTIVQHSFEDWLEVFVWNSINVRMSDFAFCLFDRSSTSSLGCLKFFFRHTILQHFAELIPHSFDDFVRVRFMTHDVNAEETCFTVMIVEWRHLQCTNRQHSIRSSFRLRNHSTNQTRSIGYRLCSSLKTVVTWRPFYTWTFSHHFVQQETCQYTFLILGAAIETYDWSHSVSFQRQSCLFT